MELRINLHTENNDFILSVDGQEKKLSYDAIRKSYYTYVDVDNINDFKIEIKNKSVYPMHLFRLILSVVFLFWFFIVMEISGFGKDGSDWKKGIHLFGYHAIFNVRNLKDKEVNIRYDGNTYVNGDWLKPRFTIADEASLQLNYYQSLNALKHGYQKYWLFFGSLNMCLIILAMILLYVILSGMIGIAASLLIIVGLIVAAVFFGYSDYRIMKDYLYRRSMVQVEGEKVYTYEEKF